MKTRNLAGLVPFAALYILSAAPTQGATVAVTFTQDNLTTTTSQPADTGSFQQTSPTPTVYTLNTEFKFFISGTLFEDPVLGTATGNLYAIPGTGCDPGDYASFPSGGIALLGDPSFCAGYSGQIAAAVAAGAAGAIAITSIDPLTFLNVAFGSPVTVPAIFVSSGLGAALRAQLTDTYLVGGSISGLTGSVTLQNNAADNLVRNANGSFTFATSLADSSTYDVTVLTQPSGQTCSVTSGSGTISTANVTDVAVTCVDDSPPPPPSPPPSTTAGRATGIPTLSAYGLVMTALGLLLVAGRRLRQVKKQ